MAYRHRPVSAKGRDRPWSGASLPRLNAGKPSGASMMVSRAGNRPEERGSRGRVLRARRAGISEHRSAHQRFAWHALQPL